MGEPTSDQGLIGEIDPGGFGDGSLPRTSLGRMARVAVQEDIGTGDLTCRVLALGGRRATARIEQKEEGVLCGLPIAAATLAAVDRRVRILGARRDGEELPAGSVVLEVEGLAASLLASERVMLNFLQRLSGIATLTRAYVRAVEGTHARILDTRKTTPGLRLLEKYAVRIGGGGNHRTGLYDGIMIKDTHIAAAGGIEVAIRSARDAAPPLARVCVEVESLEELSLAIAAGADHVLLDNFADEALREAVRMVRASGKAIVTEASGGMTLARVRAVADTGVDTISVGALTHSPRALDLHMILTAAS